MKVTHIVRSGWFYEDVWAMSQNETATPSLDLITSDTIHTLFNNLDFIIMHEWEFSLTEGLFHRYFLKVGKNLALYPLPLSAGVI